MLRSLPGRSANEMAQRITCCHRLRARCFHVVVIFSTTLHGHTFQKTIILGKSVNYEVHNLYTPHLLFIYLFINGVISNALNYYLGLISFIFGKLRVPVATSRPAILTELLRVLLNPSRQVLVQYLKFGHDRFLSHARILYSSFTNILPLEAV
jgi:hypothetical protein